jgi:hypothetical protein
VNGTPYRELPDTERVCQRCAERDARRDAIMARLTQAATYLMYFSLCMLMAAHWSTATVALASVMGDAVALIYAVLGMAAMGGVFAGAVGRDRSVAVPCLVTWTRLTSVSWAVFVWSMK